MISDQIEEVVGPLLATTVVARGSVNALTTQIVDGSGNQITSFGGAGGTASNFGSTFPSSGTAVGYTDGTNMRAARVYLTGIDYIQGVTLRTTVAGVATEFGTSTTPLFVTATGGSTIIPQAQYLSTLPALTTGQYTNLLTDSQGDLNVDERFAPQYEDNTNGVAALAIKPLAVATYSWTQFKNLQANSTLNVKASAGNVASLYCHNIGGAIGYIQLHNTATTPGGGATPIYSFLIPAGGTALIDQDFFGQNGINFATGIAFAVSSTEITYTADTAGNYSTWIQFK